MDSQSSSSNGGLWITLAVVGVGLIGVVAVIIGLGGYGNSANKPPQPINPTDATNVKLIAQLKGATDPSKTIAEQKVESEKASSTLVSTQAEIVKLTNTGTQSADAFANKKKVLQDNLNAIQQSLDQLNRAADIIRTSTSNPTLALQQAQAAEQKIKALQPDVQRELINLQSQYSGTAAEAVKLAQDLVAKNNNGAKAANGSYVIPYRRGQMSSDSVGTDNSGFLMQIWQTLGITAPGLHVNAGIWDSLPGFTTITQSGGVAITNDNLLVSARQGDLLPGDAIVSSDDVATVAECAQAGIQCHVVMYLGPGPDSPNNVAAATESTDKSGPQFTTLASRASFGSNVLAVYRPSYTP